MSDIPGATDASYTPSTTSLADNRTLLRCVVSNAAGSVTSASEMLAVSAAPTAPTKIASAVTAFAQMGAPFQFTLASSGGTAPVTYTAAPLPDGLSLDSASGWIFGTPTVPGVTMIAVRAANAAGGVSATLTLTVGLTPPAVTLDAWRSATFGASAIDPTLAGDLADPDGDGFTNLDEFTAGSNPLDATSVPTAPAPKAAKANRRRQ
jgi:Putative Ig domain